MGFGPFSNDSTSAQTQTSATDEGIVLSNNAVAARDGSIGIGQNARYASPGSIQTNRDANIGNVTAAQGATVNVGLQGKDLTALVGQLTQASQQQIDAASSLADLQSAQIGTLAENAQTGGDKSKNNTIAWLAFVAIVGAIWLGTRKHL
jgi:hypothetical protein